PADRRPTDRPPCGAPSLARRVRADVVNGALRGNLVKVATIVPAHGRIEGAGNVFVLKNRTNAESRAVAQLLAAGQSVSILGDDLVVRGPRARAILSEQSARHGFTVTAVGSALANAQGRTRTRLPRIGLYQPWTGNIDEGWTRWLFEQYGISYTTLHDTDIRKGGLRARFDVIV